MSAILSGIDGAEGVYTTLNESLHPVHCDRVILCTLGLFADLERPVRNQKRRRAPRRTWPNEAISCPAFRLRGCWPGSNVELHSAAERVKGHADQVGSE